MARKVDFEAAVADAAHAEQTRTGDDTADTADTSGAAGATTQGGQHPPDEPAGDDTPTAGGSTQTAPAVRDTATRVAVLKTLRDVIDTHLGQARGQLGQGLGAARESLGVKSIDVTLPDGPKVATASIREARPTIEVDEQALLDWVAEHHPAEVTRAVRPAFREQLVARLTAAGGEPVDTHTGEVVPWATAHLAPEGGGVSFTLLFTPGGRADVADAWRAGRLGDLARLEPAGELDPPGSAETGTTPPPPPDRRRNGATAAGGEHATPQAGDGPGSWLPDQAARALRAALEAGRAHLAARGGHAPTDAGRRGWDTSTDPPTPRGNQIGWVDGPALWLDPQAATTAVQRETAGAGLSSRGLAAALAEAGLLATRAHSTQRHHQVRRRIAGRQRAVWELPTGWLFPSSGDTAGGAGEQPTAVGPAEPPQHPSSPQGGGAASSAPPTEASHHPSDSGQQKTTAATAPGTTPPQGRPAPEGHAPQRAAVAAVVDTAGGWLAGPDGSITSADIPTGVATLADVCAWAETQPLGMTHQRGWPSDAQVWIMPDLAAHLGIGEAKAPKEGEPATTHPALDPLRQAGWNIGKGGLRHWTTVYRPGGRSLRLANVTWLDTGSCALVAGDPPAPVLAYRIAAYAHHIGIPFRVTDGVTGLDLMRHLRPRGGPMSLTEPVEPPEPFTRPHLEAPYAWQRRPDPAEAALPWGHLYDCRGLHLSACSSLRLGLGPARHIPHPTSFDPQLPGGWLVTPPRWEHARLPDPFDPATNGRGQEPVWTTTPTLTNALDLELLDAVQPLEAWVYDQHGRYLEPWYERTRNARAAMLTAADTDPDAEALIDAIKATYTRGLGKQNSSEVRGTPEYRPDHWFHVVAEARGKVTRKLNQVAQRTGRYPLVVTTDAMLYASDDPNPETACPEPLIIGRKLGNVRVIGTAPMDHVRPLLDRGPKPDDRALRRLFGED